MTEPLSLKNFKKRMAEVIYAITGIDTPFFGISWIPPVNEVEIAQGFITFIENKRVLFQIYEMEVASPVIESVNSIRQEIGSNLQKLKRSSKLTKYLIELQGICREFLNIAEPIAPTGHLNVIGARDHNYDTGYLYQRGFFSTLGGFREQFWKLVSELVKIYDLETSEHLKPFLTEYAIGEIIVKGFVHIYPHSGTGLEATCLLSADKGELWGKVWVLECPPHLLRALYAYDHQNTTIKGISIKDGEHIRVQDIKPYEEPIPPSQKVVQILAKRNKMMSDN